MYDETEREEKKENLKVQDCDEKVKVLAENKKKIGNGKFEKKIN